MSEAPSPASFAESWLEMQRAYWENWLKINQQSFSQTQKTAGVFPAANWAEILDMWWKTVSAAKPPYGKQTLEQLVEYGKQYFEMSENFVKVWHNFAAMETSAENWQKLWQEAAQPLKEHFEKWNMFQPIPSAILSSWEMPFDNWLRSISSLSIFPGDFQKGFKTTESMGIEALQENLRRMFSAPGIGYTREWQEQLQAAGKLWLEYQQAQDEYFKIFKRLGARTVDRLGEKLREAKHKGDTITRVRALYDLWVDSAEDVYQELVSTDEYAKINGRLTNTLMAWKQHSRVIMDDFMESLGLPTRREVDTLHQRLQQLRRQTKKLHASEQDGSTVSIRELQKEIQSLRAEVDALKKEGGEPAAKSSAKKTSGKTHADKGE